VLIFLSVTLRDVRFIIIIFFFMKPFPLIGVITMQQSRSTHTDPLSCYGLKSEFGKPEILAAGLQF